MLVDQVSNNIIVTNDGVTILENMQAAHPAAQMVINLARAQKDEVGDGTTTATLIVSALVVEGASRVLRGVPVTKVIEGIRAACIEVIGALETMARPVEACELLSVAMVAGRGHADLAEAAVEAAREVGISRLREVDFRLCDSVLSHDSGSSGVVPGVVIDRLPVSDDMPRELGPTRVLVLDDCLEPDIQRGEVPSTAEGIARYERLRDEHRSVLQNIVDAGVGLLLVSRGISDEAEQILADAGTIVVRRVSTRELRRTASYTGARVVKGHSLRRGGEQFLQVLGSTGHVRVDERSEHIRVEKGSGRSEATILVGASTRDVADERERIAKDSASAVQAALTSAVVPGAGAAEMAALRRVAEARKGIRGMSAYGWDCVLEALRRPLAQMVLNSGFNPLEKLEDILAAQESTGQDSLSMDCNTGEIVDVAQRGILDPLSVKVHAIRAACEVAVAILRINTIVRRKDGPTAVDELIPDRFS